MVLLLVGGEGNGLDTSGLLKIVTWYEGMGLDWKQRRRRADLCGSSRCNNVLWISAANAAKKEEDTDMKG